MTGPKLNEGALLVGDRRTTKATARYLRGSASKARVVLDLIRGLDVRRADEILQFTTRDAAADIRKVLASAVANAVHNDEQDAEELFVVACYADEGPTMRRFRPRARGRATRIRKRSCHITVIVARMADRQLDTVQSRRQSGSAEGRRPSTSARSRRDRVERSRVRAQGLRKGTTVAEEEPPSQADEAEVGTAPAPEPSEHAAETAEESASDEPQASETIEDGAVEAPEDGSIPEGYEIKGNRNSMKYHLPGSRYYDITIAEVFFDTAEHAEAAGFEAPAGTTDDSQVTSASAPDRRTRDTEPAEGSASDEAESSEPAGVGSTRGEGSASDEPQSDERVSNEEDH